MKVLWWLRCYKTSFAIAKVGKSAQRTVHANSKRCFAQNFALVKQVKTGNIRAMAVHLQEEDDS